MTKEARQLWLKERDGKAIPEGVQFVCVVGTGEVIGDGIVTCPCQWPQDLQKLGVPAFPVFATHFWTIRGDHAIAKIAELVRDNQPRWGPEKVQVARHKILGE